MEKIIGGKEFKTKRPLQFSYKLLWPCYEFIAEVEGLDSYNRNIIEEVVLKLAEIGVVEPAMVEQRTGMDRDLISFVHSRLQQRGMLDDFCHVTELGQSRIAEYSQREPESIHIYVDALSGRVIPYYAPLNENNDLRFYSFKENPSDEIEYKLVSSAGTEGKDLPAYRLNHDQEARATPDIHDVMDEVAEMLHKCHPQKDPVVRHPSSEQEGQLCYVLLDIFLYEGDSEQWGFSDGFGNHSQFFSREKIKNDKDTRFITGLRERLHKDTNATAPQSNEAPSSPFPKVQEKLQSVKTNLADWEEQPNSPDQKEKSRKARSECILSLVQLMEWTLYHLLHGEEYQVQVGNALATLGQFGKQQNTRYMIGRLAAKSGKQLGFYLPEEVAACLNERYGRIESAWKDCPTLFALVVLLLISLEKEEWLQVFAQNHSDFICRLAELNRLRNESSHTGDVIVKKKLAEKIRDDIHSFMKTALQVEIMEEEKKPSLSRKEKFLRENKRQAALAAAERNLGFSLYDSLEPGLRNLVVDMEGCCGNDGTCDNAIVLEQYKLLENILVLANRSLGNELRKSDWKAKTGKAGLGNTESLASLTGTNEDRIKKALERKPSSMTAACIAFLTLARVELLKGIRKVWPDFLPDIDYLAKQRGHGEIPEEIDNDRVLKIKGKLIELIKFFAGESFLTVN